MKWLKTEERNLYRILESMKTQGRKKEGTEEKK